MSADRHFGLSAPPAIKKHKPRLVPAWLVPFVLVGAVAIMGALIWLAMFVGQLMGAPSP